MYLKIKVHQLIRSAKIFRERAVEFRLLAAAFSSCDIQEPSGPALLTMLPVHRAAPCPRAVMLFPWRGRESRSAYNPEPLLTQLCRKARR